MDILIGYISKDPILFVFDNVDHYVDVDTHHLTGGADILVRKILASSHTSQILFTCRPVVHYDHSDALSVQLTGLPLAAALELFDRRGATASEDEVVTAHKFTNGHAFWLDLLAIQTAKRAPVVTLAELISEVGHLPENTLNSIWSTLAEREQLVLRVLAEAVKPTTKFEIGEYLTGRLNFNKTSKALGSLKAQNLIVVKKLQHGETVLELHPSTAGTSAQFEIFAHKCERARR